MNLSIGSRQKREDGWKSLDADPSMRPDYLAFIPPLPQVVLAQQWSIIEMVHVIEHFYPWDALEVLHQVHACLSPGGLLILEQPDITFAASVLLGLKAPIANTVPDQCDMWALYGDPRRQNPLYCHRWGYTPLSLCQTLVTAGFNASGIRVLPAKHHVPERDFRIEARKCGAASAGLQKGGHIREVPRTGRPLAPGASI
jgi:hypothetical protein